MAEIAPTKSDDNKSIRWANVTNGNTFGSVQIASGRHTVEVRGTHDSEVTDIHHAMEGSSFDTIDTDAAPDGLRFSANGTATLEVAGGYVKPVFQTAGGGSEDITVTITRID